MRKHKSSRGSQRALARRGRKQRTARPRKRRVPVFAELTPRESLAVLKRNSVGRIAYALHDRVMIEPVHYAIDGDWLYIRTSPGSKMHLLAHNPWVAFEVDEPRTTFDWRSVVVRGAVHLLAPDATPDLAARFQRAVPALRGIVPRTYTAADPVAFRTLVLGIHVDAITGRAAYSHAEA